MRITIFFLGVLLFGLANSSGPGITQRRDRTGSPIALNSTCSSCHYGGDFDGAIAFEVLKDSVAVGAYQPGEEYLIKIAFKHNGEGVQYGFQMVALKESEMTNAGTFGDLPEFLRKVSLYNDQFEYVEHTRPLNDSVWYIPWVAPEDGSEPVAFYAAGLVTNDNSTTSGDEVVWLRTPHIIEPVGLVNRWEGQTKEPLNIQIRTNPVIQEIQLESLLDLNSDYVGYQINNLLGVKLKGGRLTANNISVIDLAKGTYVLTIYVEKTVFSQLFIVQ